MGGISSIPKASHSARPCFAEDQAPLAQQKGGGWAQLWEAYRHTIKSRTLPMRDALRYAGAGRPKVDVQEIETGHP